MITTMQEMQQRGIKQLDIILVSGDAYVDHPTFAMALLGRLLESKGYKVGIIPRPDPLDSKSVTILGLPKMFFGVSAGAMDSMVANYTPLKKHRSDDPYSPGGKAGSRPDRALTVYCNMIRQSYGKTAFIVAGGIEASLRKFAHYDFWSDSIRRPIIMDCGADIVVHGMGENPIVDLACEFRGILKNQPDYQTRKKGKIVWDSKKVLQQLKDVSGINYKVAKSSEAPENGIELPDYESVVEHGEQYVRSHNIVEQNRDKLLWQNCSGMRVISNPASDLLSCEDIDKLYALPFTRDSHPMYEGQRIPALEQVRFSVVTHRGCFGGCAFCAIGAHQGKVIQSRSEESVLDEVNKIVNHKDFKGTIPDLGGPTANMYGLNCTRSKPCKRPSCLWPEMCKHLDTNQSGYLKLLRKVKGNKRVNHLFVTSGIRMDLALKSKALIKALAFEHTSGQMKVAPEHISPKVMEYMRKSMKDEFTDFLKQHGELSRQANKHQYVLPYLMAAHPGCTMEDMVELAMFLRKNNIRAEQCQIFTPTPGTAATVMYATGIDPATMQKVFVEKDPDKKKLQKTLILYHLPEHSAEIKRALKTCGKSEHASYLLSAATRKNGKFRRK